MKITKVEYVSGHTVRVTYADNTFHNINLYSPIKRFVDKYQRFNSMLNPEYFKMYKFNSTWNTLEWANGFDICPDLLQPEKIHTH